MESTEYYVRVPVSVLMDKRLSRSSVLLYAVLIDYADRWGVVSATIEQLAVRCKLSERTVRRSEAQLVAAGMLEISRTGRASMLRLTNEGIRIQSYSAIDQYRKAVAK